MAELDGRIPSMGNRLSYLSREELEALVVDQTRVIMLLEARIAPRSNRGQAFEAGAKGGGPPKTSRNSHQPPSRDEKASGGTGGKKSKKARPSRPGVARALTAAPDVTIAAKAESCGHCGADVGSPRQACRHAYDHIEIPPSSHSIYPLSSRPLYPLSSRPLYPLSSRPQRRDPESRHEVSGPLPCQRATMP